MFNRRRLLGMMVVVPFMSGCGTKDTVPPKVVSTSPPNAAQDVDPALVEISVTFNEPMMDKNWSWCYEDRNTFPEMTGDPYYADSKTRCVLPVKLEADKEYVIWINTVNFKNFKDKAGNPAEPYKFTFETR